jgi:signal transduction histidine kinase
MAPMQASTTRVLLVEDEISDALVVKLSLDREGSASERFDVEHAETLADGIVRLGRAPVDVLLLDLRLPDSDGPATVAQLRKRDQHVPMVVFTGTDDPDVAARAFEAGADEYLVKDDLRAGLLRRTLRHAIERRRSCSSDLPTPGARDSRDDQRFLLHDLKNLHTSILGNARILQREVSEEGFLRQRADSLLGAVRSAIDLIHRLCAGAEGAQEACRHLELSGLVREAEPLLRAVVPERVALGFDLVSDSALVDVWPEAIRRILLELMVNAVDAIGDADGKVEVRTGHALLAAADLAEVVAARDLAAGPHAWLEVRDDGNGFDAVTRARLFEPGFSSKGPGRGRGLGQVLEILAHHRGGLRVRSRPGEGSVFRVLLPSAR